MAIKTDRKRLIEKSNNSNNPNQNICAQAVAKALCVDTKVRYLHTITDCVRAARKSWNVRSRGAVAKNLTVGKARKKLEIHTNKSEHKIVAYIVRVPGHAILLGKDGSTLVDTDPRKRDCRKITHVYAVY
ncbi:MAG: hypothetical protein GY827_04460 [Cytophagales bacterium]|nr:hypothetical protein [Cytophagales bacterium]